MAASFLAALYLYGPGYLDLWGASPATHNSSSSARSARHRKSESSDAGNPIDNVSSDWLQKQLLKSAEGNIVAYLLANPLLNRHASMILHDNVSQCGDVTYRAPLSLRPASIEPAVKG